jgi:hypothetical protein
MTCEYLVSTSSGRPRPRAYQNNCVAHPKPPCNSGVFFLVAYPPGFYSSEMAGKYKKIAGKQKQFPDLPPPGSARTTACDAALLRDSECELHAHDMRV